MYSYIHSEGRIRPKAPSHPSLRERHRGLRPRSVAAEGLPLLLLTHVQRPVSPLCLWRHERIPNPSLIQPTRPAPPLHHRVISTRHSSGSRRPRNESVGVVGVSDIRSN